MYYPIVVYVLAVLSAALWGLAPIMMKKGLERGGTSMLATTTSVVTGFSLFFTLSTILYGPFNSYLGLSPPSMAIFLLGGIVGSSLGRLAQYAGVRRLGASVNTAVLNTRPLFTSILAISLLGEPFSVGLGIGIVVITVGIVMLSFSRGGDIRGWNVYELLIPLSGAVAYSTGNILRRYGFTISDAAPLSALVLNEFAAFTVIACYVFASEGRSVFVASRQTYGFFIGGSLFSSLGLLSLFVALSLGPVIVVDPLSGTAPLFAALFAHIFLRDVERVTHGVIVSAVLVILGVVLITLS